MPKTIDAKGVRRLMDQRSDVVVVDALGAESYESRHIPGSLSLPEKSPDFDARVQQVAPDKDAPIVAYCAGADCEAGPAVARMLEQRGYREVYEFRDGLAGWEDAGFSLEGSGEKPTLRVRADVGDSPAEATG